MRQLLLAVLIAGSLASDAELVQLEEENLRLKELLEQESNTLDIVLDKVAAFGRHSCSGGTCSEPPKPPPKPVSPRSPRRRLSHTAGQNLCAAAATPSFPFAAKSGWLTPAVERVSSEVTVSAGSDAPGVSWSLECDGLDNPITGGANSTTTHEIPTGACKLDMKAHGDGWSGAQWSAPDWHLGPFSLSSGGSGSKRFTVMPTASAFQYTTSSTSPPSSTSLDAGPGGSGYYYRTEVSREVITVSAGSKPTEVSWSLACDDLDYPITGGANYVSTTELPTGACILTMTSSGDGWSGAEWSAPGLGPFSIDVGSSGVAKFTVRPASFTLGFTGAEQCNGAAVATVSFQYHMFGSNSTKFTGGSDTGTLSLKSAEGATLWTKSGAQSQAANHTGWKDSQTVDVKSASFHFEYVPPPPAFSAQPVVVMVYSEGETAQANQTGTATVVDGVTYDIKTEILRNNLGGADEKVTRILVNGVELDGSNPGCNPDGGNYDCTFFDCSSGSTPPLTATSTEMVFRLAYEGHSRGCDCNKTTWESGDTSCSKEDTVAGRTPMTAVARFTLTPRMPSWATAAVAQMQVCCPPPVSSTTTTFVHHSVPHSFVDAAACLHTEGPPLTIREDATSTVSATQTTVCADSNAASRLEPPCVLTDRLRRALWQPGLPSLAGATRTWSRCLCRCGSRSPTAPTAMLPRSRSAWMPPSRATLPYRAG